MRLKSELLHLIAHQSSADIDTYLNSNLMTLSNTFDSYFPQLITNIDSDSKRVKANTLFTLTFLLDHAIPDLNLSQDLYKKCIRILTSDSEFDLKVAALDCIHHLILSSQDLFSPIFAELFSFSSILSDNSDTSLEIRSKYLQCLGSAIRNSEPSEVLPYISDLNKLALSYFTKNRSELREAAFAYFYLVLENFVNETKDCIEQLLKEIFKTFEYEMDSFVFVNEDENDYDELVEDGTLQVQSIFIDEKSAALHLIKIITMTSYSEIIERFREIEMILDYSFELENTDFTYECVVLSYKLLKMLYYNSNERFKEFWYNKIIHTYTRMITKENSIDTVSKVLGYFCKLLKNIGKILIPQVYVGVIIKQIIVLLQNSAVCQQNTTENQETLMNNLTDLVIEMIKLWKSEVSIRINDIFYLYLQNSDLAIGSGLANIFIGECGNIILEFPHLVHMHYEALYDKVEKVFTNEEDLIYRNAVCTLGRLSQFTGNNYNKYSQTLNMITWLLNNENDPGVVDNAVSALCKVILADPSAVPEQYYKIVLSNLPLKDDFEENKTIFKFLCFLYAKKEFESHESVVESVVNGIVCWIKNSEVFEVDDEDLEQARRMLNEDAERNFLSRVLRGFDEEDRKIFGEFLMKSG